VEEEEHLLMEMLDLMEMQELQDIQLQEMLVLRQIQAPQIQ
jgi:hypothetical protein